MCYEFTGPHPCVIVYCCESPQKLPKVSCSVWSKHLRWFGGIILKTYHVHCHPSTVGVNKTLNFFSRRVVVVVGEKLPTPPSPPYRWYVVVRGSIYLSHTPLVILHNTIYLPYKKSKISPPFLFRVDGIYLRGVYPPK